MPRWLAVAGCLPLIAAAPANAQSLRPAQIEHIPSFADNRRDIALRVPEAAGFGRTNPADLGLVASRPIAPNARIGFHLMTVNRPRLGPEWRTDGRVPRSRKPAVSFTFAF